MVGRADMFQRTELTLGILKERYESRADDEQIIKINGLEFVPGSLKYLIRFVEMNNTDEHTVICFTK